MSAIQVRLNFLEDPIGDTVVGHIVCTDGKRACSCALPKQKELRLVVHAPYLLTDVQLCEDSKDALRFELQRLERWLSSSRPKEGASHA